MTRSFDSSNQLSVMLGARAGNASGNYLSLFSDKSKEDFLIFIIDVIDAVFTEAADSFLYSYHFLTFILDSNLMV